MKIIDTNILNKFIKSEIQLNLSEAFYTTEDLRNEIENLGFISPQYSSKIKSIKFLNLEEHRYFDEAKYLENYKKFINKHSKIVSFYGLKGLADISILAGIETILNPSNPTLFDTGGTIEIFTHDSDFKDALKEEFDGKIIINDPVI